MKICYVNFNLDNPRDRITLRGMRENGVEVVKISDNVPGAGKYFRIMREFREKGCDSDLIMVGYVGAALVPLLKLFTRKKVVYNALCSFFDGMVLSRFRGNEFTPAALWYRLLDFLAFHSADHSFVESVSQKETVAKRYGADPRTLSVQFVGANDREFFYDPSVPKLEPFTVVFRGMLLPEAGADVVVRAAKELEGKGVNVRLIGHGLLLPEVERLVRELAPANLEFITTRLPIDDLRRKMLECHVSLGQLARHPRLETTIPHKAFESMSMKLPYLTGANRGILEVLTDNETCFTVPPGDHRALARKIFELKDHPEELEQVAENAHQSYLRSFTPKQLGARMLATLSSTL